MLGWISGRRRSLDQTCYLQKYVPRRRGSRWSQVDVRRVQALAGAGRMRPSGWAEVEAERTDGRWAAAYVSQRDFTLPRDLPADLAHAPDSDEVRAAALAALPRRDQYATVLDLVTTHSDARRARQPARLLGR